MILAWASPFKVWRTYKSILSILARSDVQVYSLIFKLDIMIPH